MSLSEQRIEEQLDDFEKFDELEFEDDEKLEIYCKESINYIQRHTWCEGINNAWLAYYLEGIFAICIFEVISSNSNVDKYVWVLTGDLPPAYIDIDSAQNPLEVLSCYIDIMQDWVETVKNEGNLDKSYPIEVEATINHADMLNFRLGLLRDYLLNEA